MMSSFVPLPRSALAYISSSLGLVLPSSGPKARPAEDAMRWRMVIGRSSGTSLPSCNTSKSDEFRDELRDGIVELPFALFIEEQHGYGDDRFSHRRDAVDGVFAQRFTASQHLIAVAPELYQLAVAG